MAIGFWVGLILMIEQIMKLTTGRMARIMVIAVGKKSRLKSLTQLVLILMILRLM